MPFIGGGFDSFGGLTFVILGAVLGRFGGPALVGFGVSVDGELAGRGHGL